MLVLCGLVAACAPSLKDSGGGAEDGDTGSGTQPGTGDGTVTTTDEGDEDGVTPEEGSAICEEATTESGCAAITLPSFENCNDCWHTCHWYTLYPTTEAEGECSYGEPEGRCLYLSGGEGGDTSLIRYCSKPAERREVFWIEDGDDLLIGFAETGRPGGATRCEIDYKGKAAAGSPSECECPCLPGYPEAECEEIGGVERCNGVPPHRIDDGTCTDPGDVNPCDENLQGTGCFEDSDCTGTEVCLRNRSTCICTQLCASDSDCDPGEACLCTHGGNVGEGTSVCVTAECATDADCPAGEVCALSYASIEEHACAPTYLACRIPYEFCNGTVCDTFEPCTYDPADQSWSCQPQGGCT